MMENNSVRNYLSFSLWPKESFCIELSHLNGSLHKSSTRYKTAKTRFFFLNTKSLHIVKYSRYCCMYYCCIAAAKIIPKINSVISTKPPTLHIREAAAMTVGFLKENWEWEIGTHVSLRRFVALYIQYT